ncbi:MAG: glycosyltransferase family 39 protein [Planctomycetes bacterium]|nr:glycosyltransferase family 39 protein [Planctomycetota bacterium]
MRATTLCFTFSALFLLHLGGAGVIDYDEACYAEVSREMSAAGEMLSPSLNGEPFFEKPPFVYWTQMVGFRWFGETAWGVRFWNACAGVCSVLLLYAMARRPLGAAAALRAALVLGTCVEVAVLARLALTDIWLVLWFTGCLAAFQRADEADRSERGGRGWFLLSCLFSGLAVLTKGAIGFVLPVGAVFVFLLRQRRLGLLLRPSWMIPGALLLFGLGLSWYVALGATRPDGFAFMQELFWEHHVGRFLDSKQGHGGPIVYYVPVLIGGALPWSAYLVAALWGDDRRGFDDARRRFLHLFSIFGALTFVFFSIAATKLPNYIGPVFPVVALLVADRWSRFDPSGRGWTWATRGTIALFTLLALAFAVVPATLQRLPVWLGETAHKAPGLVDLDLGTLPHLTAGLFAAAALGAFRFRASVAQVFTILVTTQLCFIVTVAVGYLPRVDDAMFRPLREAAVAADSELTAEEPIVLLGIRHAPSVSFTTGRRTAYVSRKDPEAVAQLLTTPGRVGIVVEFYASVLGDTGWEELRRSGGYVVFRTAPVGSRSSG